MNAQWWAERRKAVFAFITSTVAVLAAFEIGLPEGLTAETIIELVDKIIGLVVLVTGAVYAFANAPKEQDPEDTGERRRITDGNERDDPAEWFKSMSRADAERASTLAWNLKYALVATISLGFGVLLAGCAPGDKPIGTKEEALTALNISIEQLALETKRMHERGSLTTEERMRIKTHLGHAIHASIEATNHIEIGNDAGYYSEIQAAQAALTIARSLIKAHINDSSGSTASVPSS